MGGAQQERIRNERRDKDVLVQYKYLRALGECISSRVPLKRRDREPETEKRQASE